MKLLSVLLLLVGFALVVSVLGAWGGTANVEFYGSPPIIIVDKNNNDVEFRHKTLAAFAIIELLLGYFSGRLWSINRESE